ncbi:DUF3438 family protein [Pseudothauera rhizosphaerae]|uniref:DUF3438 family protein n=1 Tax=Pseudothauera rhizosphaerae TaxID=2565932 RepID=A0A4S4AS82_9RHOO|nr:DUF3438 family protein [Pseudothauera rhizosphaerae]THF62680.1 DUF3438 family protein [Pseudothauera rhizosphaerae]
MSASRPLHLLAAALLALAPLLATPAAPAEDRRNTTLGTIDLRDVRINDVIRLVAEASGVNIVATQDVGQRIVSLYLRDTTAHGVVDTLARVGGLWYRWRPESNTYLLMSAAEYQRDVGVLRDEEARVFRLRHHNVVAAAYMLESLFGERVELSEPTEEPLGETLDTEELRRNDSGSNNRSSNDNWSGRNDSNSRTRSTGTRSSAGRRSGAATAGQQEEAAQLVAEAGTGVSREQLRAVRQGVEPPIYVTYNRLHNLLVVRTGDDRALQQIAELVKSIDLPTRQVLLEMRIIEVRLDNEFRRAFDMDLFSGSETSSGSSAQPVNPLRASDTSGPRVVAGLGNYALDSSSTGLFQIINSRIRARLQLLEEKGRIHNLARPMVLASNNEPARLFIGEEVVMVTGATAQTTTGVNSPALTTVTAETEQRDIGTTLVVHPRINDDRTVTLTIDQESSRRIQGGTSIPLAVGSGQILDYPIDTMDTAHIQVAALAKDKLTIAVGGMIRAETTKSRQQIPGFGDIPVIGNLFSRDVETDAQRELVLLITPHILDNGEEGEQVSYRQISPAAEAQSRLLDPRHDAAADAPPAPGAAPAAPGAAPAAATPTGRTDGEDPTARYIRLTRHALLARRAPEEAARTAPAIAAQDVPQGLQELWPEPGIQAVALEAWRDGGLHATVVRLVNNSLRPIDIDPTRLRGHWLAATAERARLAPLDAADSAMLVVLLSDRPFAQALAGVRP